MKVFVTGGTGFIGKHLVRRLVAEGHQVTCLVRKSSSIARFHGLGLHIVQGDVNDRAALANGMEGCDWLFHLGNLYSMWEADQRIFGRVNAAGTRAVLECALEARIQKVVYVSTAAVFGRPVDVPFNEDSRPGPRLFSAYARSKADAEQIAWDIYQRTGLPLTVLYPGIVIGPGDNKASGQYIHGLVNQQLPSTIFHHSHATYVGVDDLVEAMMRAAQLPKTVGQKYLIGESIISGQKLAALIQAISGVKLPFFRFPDWMVMIAAHLLTAIAKVIRRAPLWGLSIDAARTLKNGFIFDGSKAAQELGFRYHPIEGALRSAIATYLPAYPNSQAARSLFQDDAPH